MKRLYVRPELHGRGIGRALAVAVLDAARALGYARMRLDTLPGMGSAIGLYESLGFVRIAAYHPGPTADAYYYERDLTAAPPARG
jgi:ribosomal protein S18 acetylase RimI-like enzyme